MELGLRVKSTKPVFPFLPRSLNWQQNVHRLGRRPDDARGRSQTQLRRFHSVNSQDGAAAADAAESAAAACREADDVAGEVGTGQGVSGEIQNTATTLCLDMSGIGTSTLPPRRPASSS